MTGDVDGTTEPSAGGREKRSQSPRRRRQRRRVETPANVPVGGKRHQARIVALQALYEVDVTGHPLEDVLDRDLDGQGVPAMIRAHVERLVRGTLAQRDRIDPYIGDAAPAFPVAQLPAVDRNVLRLAIYELLSEPDVPYKAAINEAVELAKRFGGESSGRFVNGVLGTVVDRMARSGEGSGQANE